MKKILSVSVLVCALTLTAAAAGCAHKHDLGDWVTVRDATCTEDGVRRRTCKDDSYFEEEVIPSPGHHEYDKNNKCIRCGLQIEYTPNLGYDLDESGLGWIVGLGSCTETTVIVPAYYAGTPVIGVRDEGFANPENVTTGGGKLQNIWLPDGIVSIGERAFYGCKELVNVILPNTLGTIGNDAFSGCIKLTKLSTERERDLTPNSLLSIGDSAFNGCAALKVLPLGQGLEKIGAFAFRGCISVASADLGANVKELGGSAFYGCTALRYVTLGGGMKQVASSTFFDCASLTEVVVPYGFEYFGSNSFGKCPSVNLFRYAGTMAEWKANVTHADDWMVGEYESDELPKFYICCSDGWLNQYNVGTLPPGEG